MADAPAGARLVSFFDPVAGVNRQILVTERPAPEALVEARERLAGGVIVVRARQVLRAGRKEAVRELRALGRCTFPGGCTEDALPTPEGQMGRKRTRCAKHTTTGRYLPRGPHQSQLPRT